MVNICYDLGTLDLLPISVYGMLYFVPRDKMHKVKLFEDFLEMLNQINQNDNAPVANNFYVSDNEKQRYEALFRTGLNETNAEFHSSNYIRRNCRFGLKRYVC